MQERFTRELHALRALAREVGERYPEVAHMMSERAADPAVERVFQGSALLLARLSDKIDGDYPELIYPYVDSLWPEELRPRPALTLLTPTLEDGYAESGLHLPAHSRIAAMDAQGEVPFLTTEAVDVWPLSIAEARIARPEASNFELVLTLRAFEGVRLEVLAGARLRLHVIGPSPLRETVFMGLTQDLLGVRAREPGRAPLRARLAVHPLAGARRQPPWLLRPGHHTPLSRLETFFALPESFSVVELAGLDALSGHITGDTVELVFRIAGAWDPELVPTAADFALCAVPAVNMGQLEPVIVDSGDGRTELRVAAPLGGEVYAVERVVGYDRKSGDPIDFVQLLDPHGGRPQLGQVCYEVQRRPGDVRPHDVYLTITDAEGRPQSPPTDRLEVWLKAVHGRRAAALRPGAVTLPAGTDVPRSVRFGHPLTVRAPLQSAIVRRRLFERLSLLTAPRATLLTEDGLRRLLREALPDPGDRPERLVRRLGVLRGSHVDQRVVKPAIEILLESTDDAFASVGEQHAFSLVLRDVLADEGYLQLEVRTESGRSIRVGTARQGGSHG